MRVPASTRWRMSWASPEVLLGLGSNLGDRLFLLRSAVLALAESNLVRLRAVSSAWLTEPVGQRAGGMGRPSRWYLNAVVACRFSCGPQTALSVCRAVERSLGQRGHPGGLPRLIDVDLLLWGDLVVDSPKLTLPHPRLEERRFVLAPACEIRPDLVHPVAGRRLADLLEGLPPRPDARKLRPVL